MYGNFSYKEREYIFLESTESTNADMKKAVRSKKEAVFSVIAADSQLSGRGRLGRRFFSPDGGIYFSVSFPLSRKEKNIPFLTLLAGLAVSKTLEEISGIKTQIKWPNDIYYGGRKLGGILCELISTEYLTAVAGIGINLSLSKNELPEELSDIVTSFAAEGIEIPDKRAVIRAVTEKLDRYVYEAYELFEAHNEVINEIRERSYSIGKKVKYTLGETVTEGIITDIKNTGAAEITLADGTVKEIFCGEITQ